mgnify:CR=1 FL=1
MTLKRFAELSPARQVAPGLTRVSGESGVTKFTKP